MPSVSVIIPAYNAEPFIAETVKSALNQTFNDLEVIVVDDGSKDRTAERLAEFGDRIRVHRQANAGVAEARNAGVKLSSGSYIAFLDADDTWLPQKLERQLAFRDAPLIYSDRFNTGARGDLPIVQSEVTKMYDGDVFLPLMLEGNFITNSSVLIRRDVFEATGGFASGVSPAEDWDLWLRVAERHPVAFCPDPLVRYRFHPDGASRNHQKMARVRTRVISRALMLERGRQLYWWVRRQVWAETWRTNGFDAGQARARVEALLDYARAAAAWPLKIGPYKDAFKVCINA
jgi:glycosyltransferase involved in cell wall biosynthesis